jgi:hypothetical protein
MYPHFLAVVGIGSTLLANYGKSSIFMPHRVRVTVIAEGEGVGGGGSLFKRQQKSLAFFTILLF